MKKNQRILKNHEFSRLISRKKTVRNAPFLIHFAPRAQQKARMGISVSKKLGNAVVRNRIKRQVRSMADTAFNFDGDYDVICIVKPPYLKNSYEENLNEFRKLLSRLKPNK